MVFMRRGLGIVSEILSLSEYFVDVFNRGIRCHINFFFSFSLPELATFEIQLANIFKIKDASSLCNPLSTHDVDFFPDP